MKHSLILFFFILSTSVFSQEEDKPTLFGDFTQFEISVPLQGNKNYGEVFPDGSTNTSWFVPDGVNANFGYGVHFNKWIGVSANTGIGMKVSEKLFMAPVFSNIRIMPKIGSESRIGIDVGLGKTFAIGRGNLTGDFKRIKLNFESDDKQLFIEVVSYGIAFNDKGKMGSISIGIAVMNF